MMKKLIFLLFLSFPCFFYSQTINEINNIFWKAVSEKDYKNQIEYGPEIVNFLEINNYPIDTAYLDFLYRLGTAYYSMSDYENSKIIHSKSLKYCESYYGIKNVETVMHKSALVADYNQLGLKNEVIRYAKSCLQDFDQFKGPENDFSILMLDFIANSFELNGELDSSLFYSEIQRDRIVKQRGENNGSFIYSIFRLARINKNTFKFKEAIDLYKKCIDLSPQIFTKEHFVYESSLYYLGEIYMELGDFNESIRLNKECLIIQSILYTKNSSEYSRTLNNLANCYHDLGNYDKSIEINLECLSIRKSLFGEESDLTWTSLSNLAYNYSIKGDWESSKTINQKLIKEKLRVLGENNESYILSISNLSVDYSALSENDSSILLLKQAYLLLVKNKLQNILLHATVTQNLAFYLLNNGQVDSAEFYIRKSLFTLDNLYGKNSFNYMNSLSILAEINLSKGFFDESFKNFCEIHDFNYINYGNQSIIYANSLSNLARFLKENGFYKAASDSIRKAIPIFEKTHGKEGYLTLQQYSTLANLLQKQGDLKSALKIHLEVLASQEKIVSNNNPDYISSLVDVANNYKELSEFNTSRYYFNKAMSIQKDQANQKMFTTILANYSMLMIDIGLKDSCFYYAHLALDFTRKLSGIKNEDYVIRLNNLGNAYLFYGDFALATVYLDSAFIGSQKTLGFNHPTTIQCYQNLASAYGDKGEYQKAIEIENICLGKIANRLGKFNLEYASGLNQLAYFNSKIGMDSLALKCNKDAYEIRKKILGSNHSLTMLSAFNLSVDYNALGKYDDALKILSQILKINIELNGEFAFNTRLICNNIGMVHLKKGDYENALIHFMKAYNNNNYMPHGLDAVLLNISTTYDKMNNQNLAIQFQQKAVKWYLEDYIKNQVYLSDMDKVNVKKKLDYYMNYLLYLEHKINFQNKEMFWYDQYISSRDLINVQLNSQDSKLSKAINNELLFKKQELIALKLKKNQALESVNYSEINFLEKEINNLEIEISSYFGKSLVGPVDYVKIQKVLTHNKNYFVDIIEYSIPHYQSSFYLAVITSKDTVMVIAFDSIISNKELYGQYRQEAADLNNKTFLKDSNFFKYLWKPIADKVKDAKTIYISLGGFYNNLNLNTIYDPLTGKYLFEENDIRIVNSARDFIHKQETEKKIYNANTASLFGFPNFDGETTLTKDSIGFLASSRDLSTFWLDSLSRGGMKAKPLPETKKEVDNISSTLKSNGWQVDTFLTDNASETNIKKQHSPRILHIATHGYFFEDIPMEDGKERFLGIEKEKVIQDPMLRSGLLLSGANKTLKGEVSIGENGLLSASEASLLDLSETELVVLSACETGKGEETNSEGVYGLRKAFSDAGAQNIIMSLWKVDDKVTQEFMSRFYEIWLNEKTTIRQAFNRTQLEIKAKYPEPYFWGAFILVGE
jgi:CHAT domain-containing protein